MTPIDRDLGEIHGLMFCCSRHDHGELAPWTTIDIHLAGRGQVIDADSHMLTMRLPRGREVELLLSLRDQVQAALSATHLEIVAEIDARLGASGTALDNDRTMEAADMKAEMAAARGETVDGEPVRASAIEGATEDL